MYFSRHKGLKIILAVLLIGAATWIVQNLMIPRTPPPPPGATAPPEQPPSALTIDRKELKWNGKLEIFTYHDQPFTGIMKEDWKEGTPKQSYPMKDGKYHGLVEEYYDNGVRSTATNFDNGRRHGSNTYWNPDGTLQKKQVWDKAKDSAISEEIFSH